MDDEYLDTTGLPEPLQAELEEKGRFRFKSSNSTIDPFTEPIDPIEFTAEKTDISKLKGQDLGLLWKSRQMALNLRYIAYPLKDGFRIIAQNGEDYYKVPKSGKAKVTDMIINGTGIQTKDFLISDPSDFCTDSVCALISTDDASDVTICLLEDRTSKQTMMKRFEIAFKKEPRRVVDHPTDPRFFVLLHVNFVSVWCITKLYEYRDRGEALPDGNGWRFSAKDMSKVACCKGHLPEDAHDAVVTVDGRCLIVLTCKSLHVWRFKPLCQSGKSNCEWLQWLQEVKLSSAICPGLPPLSFQSVYVLGNTGKVGTVVPAGSNDGEVLVLGSESGRELLACELTPSSPKPVGSVLQCVQFISGTGQELQGSVCVNITTRDSLCLNFRYEQAVFLMPLAVSWRQGPWLPFPSVQRLATDEAVHQMCVMTGKSYANNGYTSFLYRACNFKREKDGIDCCNVCVDQIPAQLQTREALWEDAVLAARGKGASRSSVDAAASAPDPEPEPVTVEEKNMGDPAEESSSKSDTSEATNDALGGKGSHKRSEPAKINAGLKIMNRYEVSNGVTGEIKRAFASFEDESTWTADITHGAGQIHANDKLAPEGVLHDGSKEDPQKSEGKLDEAATDFQDLTWKDLKHVAALFVAGLDKHRAETVDRILSEVKKHAPNHAAIEPLLDQALDKLLKAKEAQANSERMMAMTTKKIPEQWATAATSAITVLIQKEFGNLHVNLVPQLAQQLVQSKRFCEALVKGLQDRGTVAAKQAVEAIRPPKQIQETVGKALIEALENSLSPILRTELRFIFENELAPLIAKRIGDMMSSFQECIGECLESIADSQAENAKRLGHDLADVVAEELKHVEHVLAEARSSAGAADSCLSEEHLEELVQAMRDEVITPLNDQIHDLTRKVNALRQQAQDLERRCAMAGSSCGPRPEALPVVPSVTPARASLDDNVEEAHWAPIEDLFKQGLVEDAFVMAMSNQVSETLGKYDFLGRLCASVPEPWDEWLSTGSGSRLSMNLKMLLILNLAQTLTLKSTSAHKQYQRLIWIHDLWLVFDVHEAGVSNNAAKLCTKLISSLEKVSEGAGGPVRSTLHNLLRSVRSEARSLKSN